MLTKLMMKIRSIIEKRVAAEFHIIQHLRNISNEINKFLYEALHVISTFYYHCYVILIDTIKLGWNTR